jgi:3-oxoacyl-[acyl-carrier protein] reductase
MKTDDSRTIARAAIITGASRGIGAAVAERLAKDGFSVVVNYAGSQAEASALVNKITSAGGRAITAKADVSKADEVSRMFEVAEKEFGGVDVLVNNAGIICCRASAALMTRPSIGKSPST